MKKAFFFLIVLYPMLIFGQNKRLQVQKIKNGKIKQINIGEELIVVLKKDSLSFGDNKDSICKFEDIINQSLIILSTINSYQFDTIPKEQIKNKSRKEKIDFYIKNEYEPVETFKDSGKVYKILKKPIRSFKKVDLESIEYIKFPAKHETDIEGSLLLTSVASLVGLYDNLDKTSEISFIIPSVLAPISIFFLLKMLPKKYSNQKYDYKPIINSSAINIYPY